jgi:hypothetical protein
MVLKTLLLHHAIHKAAKKLKSRPTQYIARARNSMQHKPKHIRQACYKHTRQALPATVTLLLAYATAGVTGVVELMVGVACCMYNRAPDTTLNVGEIENLKKESVND